MEYVTAAPQVEYLTAAPVEYLSAAPQVEYLTAAPQMEYFTGAPQIEYVSAAPTFEYLEPAPISYVQPASRAAPSNLLAMGNVVSERVVSPEELYETGRLDVIQGPAPTIVQSAPVMYETVQPQMIEYVTEPAQVFYEQLQPQVFYETLQPSQVVYETLQPSQVVYEQLPVGYEQIGTTYGEMPVTQLPYQVMPGAVF
jgi:hypothetical protein